MGEQYSLLTTLITNPCSVLPFPSFLWRSSYTCRRFGAASISCAICTIFLNFSCRCKTSGDCLAFCHLGVKVGLRHMTVFPFSLQCKVCNTFYLYILNVLVHISITRIWILFT